MLQFIFKSKTKLKKTGTIKVHENTIQTYGNLFIKLRGDYYGLVTQTIPLVSSDFHYDLIKVQKVLYNRILKTLQNNSGILENLELAYVTGESVFSEVFLYIPLMIEMGFIKEYLKQVDKNVVLTNCGYAKSTLRYFVEYYYNNRVVLRDYVDDLVTFLMYHPETSNLIYYVDLPVSVDGWFKSCIPVKLETSVYSEKGTITKVLFKKILFGDMIVNASYYNINWDDSFIKVDVDTTLLRAKLVFEKPIPVMRGNPIGRLVFSIQEF